MVETPAVTDGRYWSVQATDQNVECFFKAGSQFTGNAPSGTDRRTRLERKLPSGFRGTEIIRASSNSFTLAVRVAVIPATNRTWPPPGRR